MCSRFIRWRISLFLNHRDIGRKYKPWCYQHNSNSYSPNHDGLGKLWTTHSRYWESNRSQAIALGDTDASQAPWALSWGITLPPNGLKRNPRLFCMKMTVLYIATITAERRRWVITSIWIEVQEGPKVIWYHSVKRVCITQVKSLKFPPPMR